MNDTMARDAASERLLTAELVEVLASEAATGIAVRRGRQWLAVAAVLLLGVLVVVGVALVRDGGGSAAAQQPAFDPVDPDYEREWPWSGMFTALLHPDRAAAAPADVDTFAVTLRDADAAELAAVLDRPAVRRLALCWRNDAAAADVAPELWQRLAARPELEVLQLSGLPRSPEQLRALRLAPALRVLQLLDTVRLDDAAARALVELPRLHALLLGRLEVTPGGVAALSGLPHLDTLLLSTPKIDTAALLGALPGLRTLHTLVFDGETALDAAALRRLAELHRLRALELYLLSPFDDAALAALPPQLELLALPNLDRCTAAGLDALRQLRHLRTLKLRAWMPAPVQRALPGVLAALPLERFDMIGEPDAAAWTALQNLPKLRRLGLHAQGAPGAIVAGSRACAHLETLALYSTQLPTPEQLAPLRDHPSLQRIELCLTDANVAPPTAEQVAALRAAVKAQVEVILP